MEKKAHEYTRVLETVRKSGVYKAPESSLFIAGDAEYVHSITHSLRHFTKVKHVVLVAIGGSIQGTQAIYDACKGSKSSRLTRIDSIEEGYFESMKRIVEETNDMHDVAVVIVSKSGVTTETMLNALTCITLWEHKFGTAFTRRVIFIGDSNSAFLEVGKKNDVLCFAFPNVIGGRFSVFTAVSIVPLVLLGINVRELLRGAVDAVAKTELAHIEKSASLLALHAEGGAHTVNFFTFNQRLHSCGLWYRQLLAESIGKSKTKSSLPFKHQLLPVLSSSADLHSIAELYLGGYQGIYTHFVHYKEGNADKTPRRHWLLEHVPFLNHKKGAEVKHIITESVLHAYNDQKLSYRSTELMKPSEYEIGFLLASLMAEVMYLGYLFDVHTFDQPSVEFYKKYVRAALT